MTHLFLVFYFCMRSLSYKVGLWGINGVHWGVPMTYSSFGTGTLVNILRNVEYIACIETYETGCMCT